MISLCIVTPFHNPSLCNDDEQREVAENISLTGASKFVLIIITTIINIFLLKLLFAICFKIKLKLKKNEMKINQKNLKLLFQ